MCPAPAVNATLRKRLAGAVQNEYRPISNTFREAGDKDHIANTNPFSNNLIILITSAPSMITFHQLQ